VTDPRPASAELIKRLEALANPANVEGMARFGIASEQALGIAIPDLRRIAKDLKKSDAAARHELAGELWASAIHEARILAALIDVPELVDDDQMESWACDLDSWDVCDQVMMNLFDKTPMAYQKAREWALRPEEFVRRAGFALMASLASHDKAASDQAFKPFFRLIRLGALDDRNFVKKAVNWALRGIGKRDRGLHAEALGLARELAAGPSRSARWVGSGAVRELESEAVLGRLQ
jgi:3-methyladenine DNA glycosylase AlkD